MKILAIGDVVSDFGCAFLRRHLPGLRKASGADVVIVNGENSADGNGITPAAADHLYTSGAHVITGGNHSFRRKEILDRMDCDATLLRPANYPKGTPGHGYCLLDMGRIQVAVINLMGTVYLENLRCPFEAAEELVTQARAEGARVIVVDFHAEATSEKRAMGFFLDGKVSALFGTHTHVQTADEQILPGGTGYITDLGMTGPADSVLGVKPELAIRKLKTKLPVRFETAGGPGMLCGCLFDIDEATGLCVSIQRIQMKQDRTASPKD